VTATTSPAQFAPPQPALSIAYFTLANDGARAVLRCVCGKRIHVQMSGGHVYHRDVAKLGKHYDKCGQAQRAVAEQAAS